MSFHWSRKYLLHIFLLALIGSKTPAFHPQRVPALTASIHPHCKKIKPAHTTRCLQRKHVLACTSVMYKEKSTCQINNQLCANIHQANPNSYWSATVCRPYPLSFCIQFFIVYHRQKLKSSILHKMREIFLVFLSILYSSFCHPATTTHPKSNLLIYCANIFRFCSINSDRRENCIKSNWQIQPYRI